TTLLSTLSLHDALPICSRCRASSERILNRGSRCSPASADSDLTSSTATTIARSTPPTTCSRSASTARSRCSPRRNDREQVVGGRSEEHTSELQSLAYLV